jgi:hypothetical protein
MPGKSAGVKLPARRADPDEIGRAGKSSKQAEARAQSLNRTKGKTMTIEEAKAIVGNQPTYALRNMIRALGMLTYLNTDEDNERKEAAQIVIRARA